MINLKRPPDDPGNFHTLFLEAGLILSLGTMLVLFKIPFNPKANRSFTQPEQEAVKMEEIAKTRQDEMPPSPPVPEVPVAVPNDQIIEDTPTDLSSELNINAALPLPAAPPVAKTQDGNNENKNKVFIAVEHMPELIGGLDALERKIVYPEAARQSGIEGRVYVQFIIDEHGDIHNPKIIRGIGGGCDQEALRVLQQAKFKPGLQRGRPVKVRYTLPILFKLVDH